MAQSGATFVADTRGAKMREIDANRQLHSDVKYGFKRSEVVRAIKMLRISGRTYAQIATYLNEQGYSSPEGKTFHSMTIKRLEEDGA